MTITGNISRSLVKNNAFTALFDLSFSNVTGIAEIGFSGENKKYNFSFISGKVFDTENRYFSSYYPFSHVLLATNFSGSAYDYAVNSSMVTYSGEKNNFYAENFYTKCTGVSIDASIVIKTKKPSLNLSLPTSFVTGETITGYFTTNSLSGVKIFTGSFGELSSFSFLSLPTGYITSAVSGQTLISQNNPTIGNFTSSFNLETNAGNYSQDFSISSVEKPFINYILTGNIDNNTFAFLAQNGEVTGVAKAGYASVDYNYFTNYESLEPSSLPLSISLSYVSGITGYYGLVADVTVESGGNGYLSAPTIIFSGGGASGSASGEAVLGQTRAVYDQVVDVNILSYGSGYTSAPTVIFSGGTGIINNTTGTIASGNPAMEYYTKSFTGCFNLYTGLANSYSNYRDNNYLYSAGYSGSSSFTSYNESINIKVEYTPFLDTNPLVAKLLISGANNLLIEQYITGVK